MNLVIFASGSGSNAENVCRHFQYHPDIKITALFCNTPNAAVIKKMERFKIPVVLFNRETFKNQEKFLSMINSYHPDYIALLGFLWKVPAYLVQAFPHFLGGFAGTQGDLLVNRERDVHE